MNLAEGLNAKCTFPHRFPFVKDKILLEQSEKKKNQLHFKALAMVHTDIYIRVIHHFFKQAQNEIAVLNVFQDLKSEIPEKSDQN